MLYVRGQAHSKTQEFENSQRVWAKTIAQNLIVLLYCKVDEIMFHLKLLLASVCKKYALWSNNIRVFVLGQINVEFLSQVR